ncbi:hypothetical protein [Streptomyces alboflavus]|uniref:hypothetical protein n=1 Tax=Streptomyces alboflavus TaxID=67267 RepID=UPI0013312C12|nr:hypothetical protein [Streptomyces alboflavus]
MFVPPIVAVPVPSGRRTGEGSWIYGDGAARPRDYYAGSSAGAVRTGDATVTGPG